MAVRSRVVVSGMFATVSSLALLFAACGGEVEGSEGAGGEVREGHPAVRADDASLLRVVPKASTASRSTANGSGSSVVGGRGDDLTIECRDRGVERRLRGGGRAPHGGHGRPR